MKEFLIRLKEADIRNVISVITAIGSFVIIFLLIKFAVPKENHDIIIASVGYILGGANGLVYAYLYSASRADKKPPEPGTKS